jgi:two-component system sensor histidine kinase KdpD
VPTLDRDSTSTPCSPVEPRAVVLVDELAHTNAPGSRHAKRWQDVEELLDAGIDVISTVNIQHLESLNDVVEAGDGRASSSEIIPDRDRA